MYEIFCTKLSKKVDIDKERKNGRNSIETVKISTNVQKWE